MLLRNSHSSTEALRPSNPESQTAPPPPTQDLASLSAFRLGITQPHMLALPAVLLIPLVTPVVFALSALLAEPRVGKA